MLRLAPLALLLLLAGCTGRAIDLPTLSERYDQTVMAQGAVSSVPLQFDPGNPPVVVNWWYVGTEQGDHHLVYRELRWDASGNPHGREERYRIAASSLQVAEVFNRTSDASLWRPLHEACGPVIPPPPDIATLRHDSPIGVYAQPQEPRAFEPSDADTPWPPQDPATAQDD